MVTGVTWGQPERLVIFPQVSTCSVLTSPTSWPLNLPASPVLAARAQFLGGEHKTACFCLKELAVLLLGMLSPDTHRPPPISLLRPQFKYFLHKSGHRAQPGFHVPAPHSFSPIAASFIFFLALSTCILLQIHCLNPSTNRQASPGRGLHLVHCTECSSFSKYTCWLSGCL